MEIEHRTDEIATARIRALCRQGFETCTPHIVAIATGQIEDAPPAVRVRAHDNLGKYGMGPCPDKPVKTEAWLETVIDLTKPYLDDQQFQDWSAHLRQAFPNRT